MSIASACLVFLYVTLVTFILEFVLPTTTIIRNKHAPYVEPAYQWINATMSAPFAARDGAGGLSYHGKMWLLGGWNNADLKNFPKACVNDVWSSTDGCEWQLEKPNTFGTAAFNPKTDWEGRHTAGYVVHQDYMWIVGGDIIQGHYQDNVWRSSDGQTWECVCSYAPWSPRALHHTVAFNNHIWVMGGQTVPHYAPARQAYYRDIWRSADGANWQRIEPKEPYWPARGMIGGCAVFNDRIWIMGGGTYDTPEVPERLFYNDVWSSADGVQWQCHTDNAPWHPRQYHEVAVFDDKLWVLEGYDGKDGNRRDVWWSSDGEHWHQLPNTPWKARHAASVFVHEDALWIVAGNNMESDAWKLVRHNQ